MADRGVFLYSQDGVNVARLFFVCLFFCFKDFFMWAIFKVVIVFVTIFFWFFAMGGACEILGSPTRD